MVFPLSARIIFILEISSERGGEREKEMKNKSIKCLMKGMSVILPSDHTLMGKMCLKNRRSFLFFIVCVFVKANKFGPHIKRASDCTTPDPRASHQEKSRRMMSEKQTEPASAVKYTSINVTKYVCVCTISVYANFQWVYKEYYTQYVKK